MLDTTAALECIEAAERETPFCWCGAPTVPIARQGRIWLRCRSIDESKGLVRRLLTLDVGHTDRAILDFTQFEAAA